MALGPGLLAKGDPTNNQRGQRLGPFRLWGGLDKARIIVPTALLVRVQCLRKGLYKAVEVPSTRPIVLLMITGSYCRRRRRLTIFENWFFKCHSFWQFGINLKLLNGNINMAHEKLCQMWVMSLYIYWCDCRCCFLLNICYLYIDPWGMQTENLNTYQSLFK